MNHKTTVIAETPSGKKKSRSNAIAKPKLLKNHMAKTCCEFPSVHSTDNLIAVISQLLSVRIKVTTTKSDRRIV